MLGTPKMCARLNFSPISMLAFPGNLFPNNNIQFKIHLIDIFDESRTFNFSAALIYSSQSQFFSLRSGENSFWSRVFSNFKLNAFCEIFNFCTNRRKEEEKNREKHSFHSYCLCNIRLKKPDFECWTNEKNQQQPKTKTRMNLQTHFGNLMNKKSPDFDCKYLDFNYFIYTHFWCVWFVLHSAHTHTPVMVNGILNVKPLSKKKTFRNWVSIC